MERQLHSIKAMTSNLKSIMISRKFVKKLQERQQTNSSSNKLEMSNPGERPQVRSQPRPQDRKSVV